MTPREREQDLIKGSQQVSPVWNTTIMSTNIAHSMKTKPRESCKPHRGSELSPGTRREIIGMRKGGMTFPEIETAIGVKANTAEKIYRRRDNGYNGKSAARSGRPPKLDKVACENLQHYILCNRYTRRGPLKDITKKLNLNCHPNTLHKALVEMGLGHRIERKRPWLSNK